MQRRGFLAACVGAMAGLAAKRVPTRRPQYFEGVISDVQCFPRCLSTAETKSLYDGLVAHYPFGDPRFDRCASELGLLVDPVGENHLSTS